MTHFQIECFLNVAKYLNFTEAANHLFIAQSSLSRNISNLEEELDMKLFFRTKKYVRLTPAGAVLYKEFSALVEQGKAAIEKARAAGLGQEGAISIGVIESQRSENFLPSVLNALREKYPNIKLSVFRGNFKELRQALFDGKIDISLTMDFDLPGYPASETIFQPFFHSGARCVLSKSHPLAKREYIHLEDLKNVPIVAINPEISYGAYNNAMELCKIHGFTPQEIHLSNSTQDTLLMVESGLGFSILDENCISSANEAIQSIPVLRSDPLVLVAIWKKDNFNPVISLFVNLLTTELPQN